MTGELQITTSVVIEGITVNDTISMTGEIRNHDSSRNRKYYSK
jgi:hypothetical protein